MMPFFPILIPGPGETVQPKRYKIQGKTENCSHDQDGRLEGTVVARRIHPQIYTDEVTKITEEGDTP